MIAVIVTFGYENDLDRARVAKVVKNAPEMFEDMPDLRYKFFTFDETERRARNYYVWASERAAHSFISRELVERVTGPYGVQPSIEFAEIAEILDNSAS